MRAERIKLFMDMLFGFGPLLTIMYVIKLKLIFQMMNLIQNTLIKLLVLVDVGSFTSLPRLMKSFHCWRIGPSLKELIKEKQCTNVDELKQMIIEYINSKKLRPTVPMKNILLHLWRSK
jgi:hypothetical protein